MSSRASIVMASLVTCALVTSPAHAADPQDPSHAAPQRSARLSIEMGSTYDGSSYVTGDRWGYALAGGVEFGRTVALTLSAGFEHYPGEGEPYLLEYSGSPPSLSVDGGGNKTALMGSVGGRLGLPMDLVEPFVEVAVGVIDYSFNRPRFVDPATGAVFQPAYLVDDAAVLGELGLGFRTRRAPRLDWMLGVRWRGYSKLFEGEPGSSFQVRLGIVTP